MEIADLLRQSYLLPQPVTFSVAIKSKNLDVAFISASFKDGLGYYLNMTFSDGHNDQYELNGFAVYNSQGKIDRYCEALKKELYLALRTWNPETTVTVLKYEVDNMPVNVWLTYYEGLNSVYIHNQLQFQLEKKPVGWNLRKDEGTTIDKELMRLVKSAINYHVAETEV